MKHEEFSDIYFESKDGSKIEGDNFVEDVQIESDLELLFSAQYIPNDSERIMLYRELDNMNNDEEIQSFTARLRDRFGEIPNEGKELIRVVSLRTLAKQLGIEKVVLKKKKMNLHLINDTDSPYYQSKAFVKLLSFIQDNHRLCELREVNDKRSVSIKNIATVEQACEILKNISLKEVLN